MNRVRARAVVFSILAILAHLSASACEPENDLPLRFRVGETANGACIPGEQRQCACSGGMPGVQICDSDGQRLLPCECSDSQPGSCTLYPDCRGCTSCFQTCICHSRGDVGGCARTCGLADAGTDTDGGGSDGADAGCPLETCILPPPGAGTACCTENGKCGFVLPLFGTTCVESNQPGTLDPSCPSLRFSELDLQGCCRPDGLCGVHEPFFPLGCLARPSTGSDAGIACTPNVF